MGSITLVTCFFDIGRKKNVVRGMERSNEEYVRHFRTWARMRNKLIIYTERSMAERLLEVRRGFGLEKQTKIVIIDNIYEIMPEIYEQMCRIEKDKSFKEFRYYTQAMSNQARYCYLVLLTYWIMNDAVSRGYTQEHAAWIDLGYNHGLDYYTNPADFDYEWKYPFDHKINCFVLYDPDRISLIDSLQFQKDCFMGGLTVMSKESAPKLWKYVLEAEKALLLLGCMDDDQQLLLMAYKAHPEDFTLRTCGWFEPLKLCGGEHLSSRKKVYRPPRKFRSVLKGMLLRMLFGKHPDFYRKSRRRADTIYP